MGNLAAALAAWPVGADVNKANIHLYAEGLDARFAALALTSGQNQRFATTLAELPSSGNTAGDFAILPRSAGSDSGLYTWSGSAWVKRLELADLYPGSVVKLTATTSATNALAATSDIPLPTNLANAVYLIDFNATNVSGPMTIAINGGSTIPLKSDLTGLDLAAGVVTANRLGLALYDGTNLRLVLSGDAAADRAAAEDARDRAEAAALAAEGVQPVESAAALQALTPVDGNAAIVASPGDERIFLYREGDFSAQIAAADPRYVALDADSDGSEGAWVQVQSTLTGGYSAAEGARFVRLADRIFGGRAAGFGGQWAGASSLTGLDPVARDIHSWAFRDGGLLYDDVAGSMSIVGHAQSKFCTEYPGFDGGFYGASIGVSGFAINDAVAPANAKPAWGGYFDAVRLNSGFTVGVEMTMANAGALGTTPTPYNIKAGGAQGGVTNWIATGAGLDTAWWEYDLVKHSSAYEAYLPSFRDTGGIVAWGNGRAYIVGRAANDGATAYVCLVGHTSPSTGTFADYRTANPSHWAVRKSGNWAFSTAYNVGDLAVDTESGNTFICAVAHTSAGSGLFRTYRASNPTHWRQNPGAMAGLVIARGALAETAAGSNFFSAVRMPEQHSIEIYRANGELAGSISSIATPNGNPARNLLLDEHGYQISGALKLANVNSTAPDRLDWYQESTGSLGMTIGGSSTGITFSTATYHSTRIGNTCTVWCQIVMTSKGGLTGAVVVTGLPFTAATGNGLSNAIDPGWYGGFAAGITAPPHGLVSGSTVALYKNGAGGSVILDGADLTNTTRFEFSVEYRVA